MTDIDPELKYCPKCHDEYRAGIKMCAGCDVELITGVKFIDLNNDNLMNRKSHLPELLPDDKLVSLQSGSLQNMKNLCSILATEMIASLLVSEDGSCGKGCCGPNFLLQVRSQDSEAALAVLADEYKRSSSLESHDLSTIDTVFDADAADTICPACGHNFKPTTMTCPECGLCFG